MKPFPTTDLSQEYLIEGSGCFRAGTLVKTAKGVKAIERIRERDRVICFDPKGNCVTGSVSKIHVHTDGQRNFIFKTKSGRVLRVTGNHWMLAPDGKFAESKIFNVKDFFTDEEGNKDQIVSKEIDQSYGTLYNLTIEPYHTMIVEGIRAHNGGGGKGGVGGVMYEEPDAAYSIATVKMLDCLSEGPLEGLVDKYGEVITNEEHFGLAVYVNDAPLLEFNPMRREVQSNFEGALVGYLRGQPASEATGFEGFTEPNTLVTVRHHMKQGLPYTFDVTDKGAGYIKLYLSVPQLMRQVKEKERRPLKVMYADEGWEWMSIEEARHDPEWEHLIWTDIPTWEIHKGGADGWPWGDTWESIEEDGQKGFIRAVSDAPISYQTWWNSDKRLTPANLFGRMRKNERHYYQGDVVGNRVDFEVFINGVRVKDDNFNFIGKHSSSFQKTWHIALPPHMYPWSIKLVRTTEDSRKLEVTNDLMFDAYAVASSETLSYPMLDVCALQATAETFSAVPTLRYHAKGLKIKLPKGYDPIKRTYPAIWNGEWESTPLWTNNPAWIMYDILTNTRYGLGREIDINYIDKWDLYEIGQYCDTLVPTGSAFQVYIIWDCPIGQDFTEVRPLEQYLKKGAKITFRTGQTITLREDAPAGAKLIFMEPTVEVIPCIVESDGYVNYGAVYGWEPRFSVSVYYQTREEATRVLNDLASSFRGMVFWIKNSITFMQDRYQTPRQLFTNADVESGMFTYAGSDFHNRYTRALVRWNNPRMNYAPESELIEDPIGLSKYGEQTIELAAFGCTSRSQARRLGHWTLYTSLYEGELVSFTTGMEGLFSLPGDIIKIQDNSRMTTMLGGRLLGAEEVGNEHVVELDRPVTLTTGKVFRFSVYNPSDFTSKDEMDSTEQVSEKNAPLFKVFTPSRVPLQAHKLKLDGKIDIIDNISEVADYVWVLEVVEKDIEEELWRIIGITSVDTDRNVVGITAMRSYPNKYPLIDVGRPLEPPVDNPYTGSQTVRPPMPANPYLIPPDWIDDELEFETLPPDQLTSGMLRFEVHVAPSKDSVAFYLTVSWEPSLDEFVTMYEILYRYEDDPILRAGESVVNSYAFHAVKTGNYIFYVRAVNARGLKSVPLIDTYFFEMKGHIVPAEISGLRLKNSLDGTHFNEVDAEIDWRLNHDFASGNNPDNPRAPNAEINVPLLQHYQVDVYGITQQEEEVHMFLRREEVKDRNYTYTFQNNIDDARKVIRDKGNSFPKMYPALIFVVRAISVFGDESNALDVWAINPPPGKVENFTAVAHPGNSFVSLSWEPPVGETDIVGYGIYSRNLLPTPGEFEFRRDTGAATSENDQTPRGELREYKVVARDRFSQLGEGVTATVDTRNATAITGFVADSSGYTQHLGGATPIIALTWDTVTDPHITEGGHLEIQWRRATTGTWRNAAMIPGDSADYQWTGVGKGGTIDLRIRTVNAFTSASNWANILSHTVVGKTAAPAVPTGFAFTKDGNRITFTWDKHPETDVFYYEINSTDTDDNGWEKVGVYTSRESVSHTHVETQMRVRRYYLRAGNTSGVSSDNTAYLEVDPNATEDHPDVMTFNPMSVSDVTEDANYNVLLLTGTKSLQVADVTHFSLVGSLPYYVWDQGFPSAALKISFGPLYLGGAGEEIFQTFGVVNTAGNVTFNVDFEDDIDFGLPGPGHVTYVVRLYLPRIAPNSSTFDPTGGDLTLETYRVTD